VRRLPASEIAVAVIVLGALVAAALVVGSANAAPSKKNFTVQVAVTKPASGSVNPQNFTVTITNDRSSNTTFGSANVRAPAGFTVDAAGTAQPGWSATLAGGVIQLRTASSSDALVAGQSMIVTVHVASPTLPITAQSPTGCTGTAAWSAEAKQSNDFNGTNNWFTLLPAGSDLTPLGSFEIADIGTQITVDPFFTPAILLRKYTSATTAFDTCHNVKPSYSGATLGHHGLTGATISPATSLSWSDGVGKVDLTPAISETDNTVSVTDPTTGISDTSNLFDTQQKLCTFADPDACEWQNGNGSIRATAPKPATGSLGVGFNPAVTFTCNNVSGGSLGGTVITISPHDTGSGAYQVTLVYSKQVSGTGNANAFIFCESTDDGASFQQLPSCSASGTGADCIVDQKRVTGGALQVILNLLPGDPYVGGR
jgi:hypothetical protein